MEKTTGLFTTMAQDNKIIKNISELYGWRDNPRNINKKDFERLKGQIKKLGQYKPLLITKDGEVIGGNMRLKAYKDLGITDIWVSVVEPKDDNEKLEYALSDNDRAGYYDDDMLANLIPNYDIDWSQYAVDMKPPEDIQQLIDRIAPVEEDEVPEVSQEEPISKLGEVYQLGRHRLMCGDSTKIEDVEKLMDGKKADMVFTDPPYGIGIDGQKESIANNPKHNRKEHKFRGWDNERPSEDVFNYIIALNVPSAIFGGNYFADLLPASRGWIYWGKGQDGDLTSSDGELAWTNINKPLRSIIINRGTLQGSVHPTQKPIEVVTFILKYLGDGENVLDLFGGSGSTLIACEQTQRTCYMMELDPKYIDVIRKRYAKFIGKEDSWQTTTPLC